MTTKTADAETSYDRAHGGLELLLPGLHATVGASLSFAPKLRTRSFLLEREPGNLLVYASSGLDSAVAGIEALGGASRWFLSHGHEAMFLPAPEGLGVGPIIHQADREAVAERGRVRAGFSRRHLIDDDFEVIPVPGHTPGATAYLWEHGGRRMLFTGDSLYIDGRGEWIAAVLGSSDRESYLESLELIRGLDFDVLVPWATGAGRPAYAIVDETERRRRLDAVVERVRAGESR